MNDHFWDAYFSILGGIISGAIGWIAAWWLNKHQRKEEGQIAMEARKRKFLAAMKEIRHRASLVDVNKTGETYKGLLPLISRETAFISDDIYDSAKGGLDNWLIRLYQLDGIKIENYNNQAEILNVIENITGFVERNHKSNPPAATS